MLLLHNTRPYLTVSQVVENPSEYTDREIEVIGIVQDYSGGDFNLTEGDMKIMVQISGITVPEKVDNGIEVVVKGVLRSSLILEALQILTQCS